MKLALITGLRHGDSLPVVVAGPSIPHEVAAAFKALAASEASEFSEIKLWLSAEGVTKTKRFALPAAAPVAPFPPDTNEQISEDLTLELLMEKHPELAARLADQFESMSATALRSEAEARGLDIAGLKSKGDLVEVLVLDSARKELAAIAES